MIDRVIGVMPQTLKRVHSERIGQRRQQAFVAQPGETVGVGKYQPGAGFSGELAHGRALYQVGLSDRRIRAAALQSYDCFISE
jgi:hypothetical protein